MSDHPRTGAGAAALPGRVDRRFRELFSLSSDALLVLDAGGLRACNESFRQLFALVEPPDPGFDWAGRLDDESRELALGVAEQWRRGRTRFPRRFAVRAQRPGGGWLELEVRLALVSWESAPAALVLVADRSETLRLERQLRQAEKLETLGQLAGGVAHDFNNLLAAISGHVELAMLAGVGDGARSELDGALDAVGRARGLTGQLLAFSRRQPREPVRQDLAVAVRERLPLLQGILGRRYEISLQVAGSGRVRLDATELEQVLLNLVVNARDAMPAGGRLRLRVLALERRCEGGRLHGSLGPGGFVQLRVQDEGMGIPESVLDRIFDPLFSTKPEGRGTGLGLSTVYGIVKRAGGQIHVTSCPDWGTRFDLEWPLAEDAARPLPVDPVEPEPRRVLWIGPAEGADAERLAALEREGHWIRRAHSRARAEKLLGSSAPRPDLVVDGDALESAEPGR